MNDDNDINKMKTFITIISFGSSVNIYIYIYILLDIHLHRLIQHYTGTSGPCRQLWSKKSPSCALTVCTNKSFSLYTVKEPYQSCSEGSYPNYVKLTVSHTHTDHSGRFNWLINFKLTSNMLHIGDCQMKLFHLTCFR